jgi:hypothetical protein
VNPYNIALTVELTVKVADSLLVPEVPRRSGLYDKSDFCRNIVSVTKVNRLRYGAINGCTVPAFDYCCVLVAQKDMAECLYPIGFGAGHKAASFNIVDCEVSVI